MAAVVATLAASAPAQRQFDELQQRGLPAGDGIARAVVMADVDADGDLDLVVGDDGPNQLFLSNGAGGYTDVSATNLPVDSETTTDVVFGDVDGDGDLDMVLANNLGQNRLYVNDGTGAFTDVTAARMPVDADRTFAVTMGDVDGDGDLDIVFGNGGYFLSLAVQNKLYLNDGTGTYSDATAAQLPTRNDNTMAVALSDVDADGDLELIVGNHGNPPEQNLLYENDGSGTFTDATLGRMPAVNDFTHDIAVGDVDGDGDPDIVVGNGGQDRLLLNNGVGEFVDFTDDFMPFDNDATLSLALGDVDGDGDLDIVFGNGGYYTFQTRRNRLYLNNGTGAYTDATVGRLPVPLDNSVDVAVGDVDGDGDADIVFANAFLGPESRLYLNDGHGSFTDGTPVLLPAANDETRAVALGDVDGDGDSDLVFANGEGERNRLYLNDGAGSYMDVTLARMPADADRSKDVALGDVDGDGDLDMVFANQPVGALTLGQQNRLYLNDGTGTFSDATAARMPADLDWTQAVVLADVDADGDLDIVFGNNCCIYGVQNQLYLNDGSGFFTDATVARMPAVVDFTNDVALGDVDGDGDLDMMMANDRQNVLLLNDGSGTYTDATAAGMPVLVDRSRAVALGDVDGDGDLDAVFGNDAQGEPAGEQNRLYVNDGTGIFSDVTAAQLPVDADETTSVSLGDVDGDGDLDMILGNGPDRDQENRLYVNDGTGTFTDLTAVRMPALNEKTPAVVLGDVDADGDLDVVFGNGRYFYDQRNRLYINLNRQLAAPFPLRLGRPYRLEAYARYGPPSAAHVAVPFISTGAASIPFPPLGTVGLDPAQMLALPPFFIPQPAGVGSIDVPVPNIAGLVGVPIYAQAVIVQNPFPAHLTNVTADVIGQ